MSEKRHILAIVEPENEPAIVARKAAWFARANGFGLTLIWCDADVGPLDGPFLVSNAARDIARQIRAAQQQMVEELAEEIDDEGVPVAAQVLAERPIGDSLLSIIDHSKPAFVFKGTRYHDAAERSIFVDTDWQLMRGCSCPLWLVKRKFAEKRPTIVAAVDPMHTHDKPAALDTAIVEQAKMIAELASGDVHLFHAYQPMAGLAAAANRTFKPVTLAAEEIIDELREEHQQKLNDLAASCGIDAEHTHQLSGVPREVLPAFVRSINADLVVMGTQARWGLKRAVIGSTAERVLDHLPCDTLLVKPAV